MRKVFIIALNDLHLYFQDRSNWFFVTVMPIIFVLIIGVVFRGSGGGPAVIPIDVLDQDGSPASAALVEALLTANPTVIVCPYAATGQPDAPDCELAEGQTLTEALAAERLTAGTVYATLTIPAGYSTALEAGEPVELVFRADPALSAPGIARQTIAAVVTRLGGATVAARLSAQAAADLNIIDEDNRGAFYAARYAEAEAAWGPPAPITVTVETAQAEPQDQTGAASFSGFAQSSAGMAAMYAMINVLGLAAVLIQERQDGTLPRLMVTPISRSQILGGKILRGYLLGLLQFAILLAVGALLGVNFGRNIPAVIVVVLAYVFTISAMAIALAALARTPEQASGLGMLATMTLAPLGGAWWPLEIVPQFMQVLGHLSPIAWCMDAFNTILYDGGGIPEVIGPVLVLLAVGAAFFALGVRRFRYE